MKLKEKLNKRISSQNMKRTPDFQPVVVFLVDWIRVIRVRIFCVSFQLDLRHPKIIEPVRRRTSCVEPNTNPKVKLGQVSQLRK